MIAVDSSVLIAIFKGEATGAGWLDLLLHLRSENPLGACDVAWSEVAPLFTTVESLRTNMARIGVHFSPLDEKACFAAGQFFASYRKRRGNRTRMIPDFMIAAHALRSATALATADIDFMGTHFPRLKLIKP